MDYKDYFKELISKPIQKELPFTKFEYQDRLKKIKKSMDNEGLDALLVTFHPDIYYLAGYNTFALEWYTCLLITKEGAPVIQVASIEIGIPLLHGWIEDIIGYNWTEMEGISSQMANVLKERGLTKKTIGVEAKMPGLPSEIYNQLQRKIPDAHFKDASDIVLRTRMIKSPKELEYLREAARITYEGIKASLSVITSGKTDNDIAKVGHEAMIGAGSEFMSVQPIVTSGYRCGYAHTSHRRIPLRVGDTVFLEYGGTFQRYTAPIFRTAFIGKPTDQVRRLTMAVKDTINQILESVRPERTCHEVAIEAHKVHRHIDSEVFFHGVYGYTVGAGFPPAWAEGSVNITEGDDQLLMPGMTFHLPISFRVPGELGVALSETIAISKDGCEILTQKDRDLHVVNV